MQRREFLKYTIAGGLALTMTPLLTGCINHQKARFVSAASNHFGEHFIVAFDSEGRLLNQVKIKNRGHDLVMLDDNRVVAFSRRPFDNLFIIDLSKNTLAKTIKAESGFHFYGHGVYDKKRQCLITTENEIATGNGYLVVRDSHTFDVIARFRSGGIGPHQCALMPDSQTLVVANGGIKTHPEKGREKLNLDTMKPNLSYINLDTGKIVEVVEPNHFQLSLRHLAVADSGEVIVGAQYQGHYRDELPLVFSHQRGQPLNALAGDGEFWRQFKHYIASISITEQQQTITATSPRGGRVAIWHLKSHKQIGDYRFADCAGVAATEKQAFITNGKGMVLMQQEKSQSRFTIDDLRFDNHLIRV